MTEDDAKRAAGSLAWSIVKEQLGATTLLELTRDKMLPLLQRTHRLEKSLRPGKFNGQEYEPPLDQVYSRTRLGLTWGTSVEYANRVSQKRPIWPDSIDPWLDEALEAGINAVVNRIREVLT